MNTAIISSQIFFNVSLAMISSFHHLRFHIDRYKENATRYFIMLAVDCFINVFCTFLSFKYEEKWYWRTCSWCHRFCDCLCSKCVACKVKSEAAKMHQSMQESMKREPDTVSTYDTYCPGTPHSSSLNPTSASTRGVSRDLTTSLYE